MHIWRKVAAILIGVLTLSGIAFAAVHIMHQSQQEEVNHGDRLRDSAVLPTNQEPVPLIHAKAGPVVFDNVTLDSIARDIAAYHHLDADLQNEQASELRFYFVWNQDESLQEVIEKLNMFEQVNLTVEDRKLIVR